MHNLELDKDTHIHYWPNLYCCHDGLGHGKRKEIRGRYLEAIEGSSRTGTTRVLKAQCPIVSTYLVVEKLKAVGTVTVHYATEGQWQLL